MILSNSQYLDTLKRAWSRPTLNDLDDRRYNPSPPLSHCSARTATGLAALRAAWPRSPCFLEREDCTPIACYRSIDAPRTGGAYDSHLRTAGIVGRTRRRGSSVAARGVGPAAEGADHRRTG